VIINRDEDLRLEVKTSMIKYALVGCVTVNK